MFPNLPTKTCDDFLLNSFSRVSYWLHVDFLPIWCGYKLKIPTVGCTVFAIQYEAVHGLRYPHDPWCVFLCYFAARENFTAGKAPEVTMLLESIPKGPIPTSWLSALSFLLLPTKIVLQTAIFEIMRLSPSVLPLSSCNSKPLWLPWRRPPRQPPLPRVVMNSWNPVQRIKAVKPVT